MARINDQNDVPTIRKPQCRSSTCHQDGAARSLTYIYRLMATRQSGCILVTRGLIKVKEKYRQELVPADLSFSSSADLLGMSTAFRARQLSLVRFATAFVHERTSHGTTKRVPATLAGDEFPAFDVEVNAIDRSFSGVLESERWIPLNTGNAVHRGA